MDLLLIRIVSVVLIAAAYMLFDIFNRRNVPEIFAFATLGYGAVLTLLYLNTATILTSTAIALIVLGLGYLVYRAGQLGAADVIEFASLSLIIPVQPMPLLMGNMLQFGMPFVVSIMIGAGIAALVIVPLYYIPKAKRTNKSLRVSRRSVLKAAAIAGAYLLFMVVIEVTTGITLRGLVILAMLFAGSAIITLFEGPITSAMVRYTSVGGFDEGDFIALNLMSKRDIEATRKRVKRFDRLATPELIKEMRAKHIKRKFPVYKEALPLALPIFIGVAVSLLFGDIFIFILPAL
jgi:Flp pilus assembly protein protease CpaA